MQPISTHARFIKSSQEAGQIVNFYFEPLGDFSFLAGQFIELTIDHDQPDERGYRRWFTLSSSPTENLLTITTRLSQNGSSFKQALRALELGSLVKISQPMGDFVLPKDPTIPLSFIAIGLGITPFRSHIRWLADTNQQRQIKLIYSGKSPQLPFEADFTDQNIQPTKLNHQPATSLADQLAQIAKQNLDQSPSELLYIAGNELAVERTVKLLTQQKIDPHRIVTDFFHGYE